MTSHHVTHHVTVMSRASSLSKSKSKSKLKENQNQYKIKKIEENKNCYCPKCLITLLPSTKGLSHNNNCITVCNSNIEYHTNF